MADLPHRRHDNSPLRRVKLPPRSSNNKLPERKESMDFWKREGTAARPSFETQPAANVAALLKRIRAHPEAERILGNSLIPVVGLERLSVQSVSLMRLQPVVSPVHLHHPELPLPQQTGLHQSEVNTLDFMEDSPGSEPAAYYDLGPPGPTSIICSEQFSPYYFPCQDPNPDQPGYILFDSRSDEWALDGNPDCGTFYLDPDLEHTVVIQVDPDGHAFQQIEECNATCEEDVADMEESERPEEEVEEEGEERDLSIVQSEPGDGARGVESEDFCAVCLNGGDLLCCDSCPKVYHLACHVPSLSSSPLGDWVCTLCRTDQEPEGGYDCEGLHHFGGVRAPCSLSSHDQRRCEKLTLLLLCHQLSAPFHEPVSHLARNYYQIIKRPVDLSLIRRKLEQSATLPHFSAEQFVDDVLLMFRNCATFNAPDSDVAQAGRTLLQFFLAKLREIFPECMFPSAARVGEDAARLHWLNRKKTENCRKRRRPVVHRKNIFI